MRVPLVLLLALVVLAALSAPALANGGGGEVRSRSDAASLKVMTRNLYLGTDLIPIAVTTTRPDFERAASAGYANVRATDFRARARLLAREIRRRKPDVIGLQEAALWRAGPKDGIANNETVVALDWLAILRRELERVGLRYRGWGAPQQEFDFSGPTASALDIRLTMRDAILVRRRKGLRVTRFAGRNFENAIEIPLPALDRRIRVNRGWISVNGSIKGKRFRVVNTHLEAYTPDSRLAQARELIARGGPARSRRRVILIGDLNSDPRGDPNGEGDPVPYDALTDFGFRDSWTRVHPDRPGYACCLDHKGADGLPDLVDPPPFPADHRIDHILYKGRRIKAVAARRVGLSRRNRTADGLWPSDHGGTVTRFRLR